MEIDWSKPLECDLGDVAINEAMSCRGGSSKYLAVYVGENENKIMWCVREDGAPISTRINFAFSKVRNKKTNRDKAIETISEMCDCYPGNSAFTRDATELVDMLIKNGHMKED